MQERLQKPTFWSDPCWIWRKSSLAKYEEGVNWQAISIRILTSLWNWWSYGLDGQTSHSSFFSRLIPRQIVKPIKKPPENSILSEKVWLPSSTCPAQVAWGSLVYRMLWNPWISIQKMQLATSPTRRKLVFSLECAIIGDAARCRQGIGFLGASNSSEKSLWNYQKLWKAQ